MMHFHEFLKDFREKLNFFGLSKLKERGHQFFLIVTLRIYDKVVV